MPATVRDAAHVLDGILDNQTELEIAEHTTDTHGYTEIVFATFDLLGLRFAPRSAIWTASASTTTAPADPPATPPSCYPTGSGLT